MRIGCHIILRNLSILILSISPNVHVLTPANTPNTRSQRVLQVQIQLVSFCNISLESLIVQGRNKIKNHLLENYNEEKEKALIIVDNYLEDYEREKAKRASFQYQTTEEIKENKARTSLSRAKEFIELIFTT